MTTTVLLTGASGFIALHVLDTLLKKGYAVVGTVRSKDKADKITAQFKELYPNAQLTFEIVGDIAAKGAFDETLKKHPEITEVIHTASPFSYGLNKDFKDAYYIPATEGTKNVLEAIQKYAPQVKHYVQTSSFAAIVHRERGGDKSFIHTEATWNPITWDEVDTEVKGYVASKKLAEELARKFVAEQKPNFSITTVNPPFVLGPQKFSESLVNPTLNTSAEIVNSLFKLPKDDTENHTLPAGLSVDVRDVALLHVLPLEKDLADKRFFPVNGAFNLQTLLNLTHKLFPELNDTLAKGQPEGAEEQVYNTQTYYDTSKSLEWSGLKSWIPLETTIKDSVQQILDFNKTQV